MNSRISIIIGWLKKINVLNTIACKDKSIIMKNTNFSRTDKIIKILISTILLTAMNTNLYATTYIEALRSANAFLREKHKIAASDPTRPIFHLQPPSNWQNDPCGPFYYNGSFHVFFQTNPWGSQWGNMSWSQVVSDPNNKWNYKWLYPVNSQGELATVAIIPSLNPNAADHDGIFTGSVKVLPCNEKNKKEQITTSYCPTAFYSAVWGDSEKTQEVICMARALKAGRTDKLGKIEDPYISEWTKISNDKQDPNSNPSIIIFQPAELNLTSFRDPYVFTLDDGNYYMLVSAGYQKGGEPFGALILYRNNGKDLTKNWKSVNKGDDFFYSATVAVKNKITNRGDFECGAVFRLTDHIGTTNSTPYILIYGQDGSPGNYGKSVFYLLGSIKYTYSGIHFEPIDSFKNEDGTSKPKALDLNPDFIFYAPHVLPVDNEQRQYLFGWLNIGGQAKDGKDYSWHGMLSIPRFLFAYEYDKGKWELGQDVALVNSLRKDKIYNSEIHFSSKSKNLQSRTLSGVSGRYLNIVATFSSNKKLNDCKFGLELACSQDKSDRIFYDGTTNLLHIQNHKLELNVPNNNSKKLSFNVYLDGSALEIFISKFNRKGVAIPYKVYSAPLTNNGNLKNETLKVTGIEGISAEVEVFTMDTCWIHQEL